MFSREFRRAVPKWGGDFPRIGQGTSPGHPQEAPAPEALPRRCRPAAWRARAATGLPSDAGGGDTGAMDHPELDGDGRTGPGLGVGLAVEDWTGDARFHEYSAAVDPIGSGPPRPSRSAASPPRGTTRTTTRVVDLDLSDELGTPYPATGPSLLARFVCIAHGDEVDLAPNATSMLFYCLRGCGHPPTSRGPGGRARHLAGPATSSPCPGAPRVRHGAEQGAVLYHVDDSPLLAYLGVEATEPRFVPTRFDGERARARLAEVAADPDAHRRSRVAVLLGNARNDQTLTATHTLWAMLGVLPEGHVQRPHRHQSIALDLIVHCDPGLLHPRRPRDPTGRHHRRPGTGGLGARRRLRDPARALAQPPQRVGVGRKPVAGTRCRAAHLPPDVSTSASPGPDPHDNGSRHREPLFRCVAPCSGPRPRSPDSSRRAISETSRATERANHGAGHGVVEQSQEAVPEVELLDMAHPGPTLHGIDLEPCMQAPGARRARA